ncbi:MAG TPA: hypothetical protein VGW98_07745 [Solirubrobacteraceae bacterium]|jgi:hypothetical protein|nr:hypothetical protein [Solirubrobacteraceae bacterium]
MKKKLVIGLAPLLVTAVFAARPGTAQAVPHWTVNGSLATSAPVLVKASGVLSLVVVKGGVPGAFVTCAIAEVGTINNPTSGAGVDAPLVMFAFAAHPTTSGLGCESQSVCPAADRTDVTPYSTAGTSSYFLDWGSILEPSGAQIRDKITGINLKIDCVKNAAIDSSIIFVGATAPLCLHGTSALHPGFLEWAAGSGELEVQGSGGAVTADIEGAVQMLGYEENELINCRST